MAADARSVDGPGTPVSLLQMMTGYWVSQAIYVAAKLGIADHIAAGAADSRDLADATHTDAQSLQRLLRALVSIGVFSEATPGEYGLTPVSALLRTGTPDSMRALAIMYNEEQYRAWADLLFSVRTGKPAFEHTFGKGIFEYFRENPEPAWTFGEAMTAWTNQLAGAVVAAFDFSPFSTVVDVGGSHGTLLAAILRKNPATRGILFDLPNVIAGAAEHLAAEGVADRCTHIGGDFFEAVPAGGDLYVMAQILHDWDDERCVAILRRCRTALRDGGKLLIVELVLPPGDGPFFGKWLDLHMLVMASGRERTAAEYQQLLQAARFELTHVQPTAAGASIVEAV
ncbi:MAG: hypothetical protein A3H97_14160 [Acidobacteria bacterium RIFCSPLOWO2_02_FULL_65_29]|nr:MAG: hypothetical protein A3H97_14160 [Acidobacteria bacterium RIFCSPLOWO2_02_FULL_65_29]